MSFESCEKLRHSVMIQDITAKLQDTTNLLTYNGDDENIIIPRGVMVIDKATHRVKVGDGTKTFNELPFILNPTEEDMSLGPLAAKHDLHFPTTPFGLNLGSTIVLDEAQAIKFETFGSRINFPTTPMNVKSLAKFPFYELDVWRVYCEAMGKNGIDKCDYVVQYQFEKGTNVVKDVLLFYVEQATSITSSHILDLWHGKDNSIIGAYQLETEDKVEYIRLWEIDHTDHITPEVVQLNIYGTSPTTIKAQLDFMLYRRDIKNDEEEFLLAQLARYGGGMPPALVGNENGSYMEVSLMVGVMIPHFALKII